ncbi:MAG: CBS domain-containing protein [Nitrososphaerales archaeon]
MTVIPDTFITEALTIVQTRNIRRLPVVNAERLLRIMTEINILYWFLQNYKRINANLINKIQA